MDLFAESHHSSEQKYFQRIGRTRVRDPGKGQAESARLDVRVKHGEVVRRPLRLGSRSRSGITTCHQAPKENRARHMHVWQEGRSHLGLHRRPGDRKKVRYQVHRSSSCLRMWLLRKEGPLILRTGVALWLFSGPLNPEPNLTRTESSLASR